MTADTPREATDWQRETRYRARVEQHRGRTAWWRLRRIDGWRAVIETTWTGIEQYRRAGTGKTRITKAQAEIDGHAVLDAVEAANPSDEDYLR